MIVADVNLLAYLLIEGDRTADADRVLAVDPEWVSPPVWRSEFRNVLVTYRRADRLTEREAISIWDRAESIVRDMPYPVDTEQVIAYAVSRRLSAYDAEYVSTAVSLGVPLVTADKRLLAACPDLTVSIEVFGR